MKNEEQIKGKGKCVYLCPNQLQISHPGQVLSGSSPLRRQAAKSRTKREGPAEDSVPQAARPKACWVIKTLCTFSGPVVTSPLTPTH